MPGKQYKCNDCGRAFRVYEEEEKEGRQPKCPSCESENTASWQAAATLPSWMSLETKPGSG